MLLSYNIAITFSIDNGHNGNISFQKYDIKYRQGTDREYFTDSIVHNIAMIVIN